jgi:hypothetical protein
MKKIVFVVVCCLFVAHSFSQDSTSSVVPAKKTITLSNRPNDHIMIQLSSDHWTGMPDSIKSHQQGLSRGFNAYFMLDKPFKSSPNYSIGFGIGISTSNIIFKRTNIGLEDASPLLAFTHVDSTSHFKRYKLATGFLEVPIEFRYSSKPLEPNKSFKVAIGAKIGTLINAHTKGKTLQDKNNNTINTYTEKENSKHFIDGTRLMGTARVGYGIFSLFGSYQINNLLKAGTGPTMHLYQVGITLSGL